MTRNVASYPLQSLMQANKSQHSRACDLFGGGTDDTQKEQGLYIFQNGQRD